MQIKRNTFSDRSDHILLKITEDNLSRLDFLDMEKAELPEILVTGGKNNLATYLIRKNHTKLIENSLEQSLIGATSFKLQGRVNYNFNKTEDPSLLQGSVTFTK